MITGDEEAFARLVEALRPWLQHLVIIGGWAHRLHRLHQFAVVPQHAVIRTREADIALPVEASLTGDIGEALKRAGFDGHFFGDHTPPITRYSLGDEEGGFYAEFLTPLSGSGLTRAGEVDATVSKSGITAQKLRYLDLLLILPWSVRIGAAVGFPTTVDLDVPIANPVSFIVQKLLIHEQRSDPKKAQDILYIYDTLQLFGGAIDRLHHLWLHDVRSRMHQTTVRRTERLAREMFAVVTDHVRDAARIPPDRQMVAEDIRATCSLGLQQMLL